MIAPESQSMMSEQILQYSTFGGERVTKSTYFHLYYNRLLHIMMCVHLACDMSRNKANTSSGCSTRPRWAPSIMSLFQDFARKDKSLDWEPSIEDPLWSRAQGIAPWAPSRQHTRLLQEVWPKATEYSFGH